MNIEAKYGKIIIDGQCSMRDALLAIATRYKQAADVQERLAVVAPGEKRKAIAAAQEALRRGQLYLAAAKTARGGSVDHRETLTIPDHPRIE